MFENLLQREQGRSYTVTERDPRLKEPIARELRVTLTTLRNICGSTADLQINEMSVSGISLAVVLFEGLADHQKFSLAAGNLLRDYSALHPTPQKLMEWAKSELFIAGDKKPFTTYGQLLQFIMSGFAAVLIDGCAEGLAAGVQGFSFRSVSEPSSENNLRGSREGFVEALRINMSMVRRRMKTPALRMELFQAGKQSNTDICLLYRSDLADAAMLEQVRTRIAQLPLDNIMESGYIRPFLDNGRFSLFSGVGTTERPDTLCAKLSEGRIAILVDGTPFALVLPYLFSENFQSLDDYAQRPYYATLMRWLKYGAFFLTILLPGTYVATLNFHPELLPDELLFRVAAAEQGMAFPLMFEALLIHFIYELMREAGLRLPRPVGHAVSIIGALVIGDAAVTAGLISTPMVMVVALTTISSFVIPSLYEPVTLLRFVFILLGGTLGIFGIVLGLAVVGVDLCSVTLFGVPATSPESPVSLYALRDTLVRSSWKKLGRRQFVISRTAGAPAKEGQNDAETGI